MEIFNTIEQAYSMLYRIQYLQELAKLTDGEIDNPCNLSEYAYVLDEFLDKLSCAIAEIDQSVKAIV